MAAKPRLDVEGAGSRQTPFKHLKTSASERLWEFLRQKWWPMSIHRPLRAGSKIRPRLLWTHHETAMGQYWGQLDEGLAEGKWGCGISWIGNILMCTGLTGTELMSAVGLRDRRSWATLVHSCSQPSQSDDGVMTWQSWQLGLWKKKSKPFKWPRPCPFKMNIQILEMLVWTLAYCLSIYAY